MWFQAGRQKHSVHMKSWIQGRRLQSYILKHDPSYLCASTFLCHDALFTSLLCGSPLPLKQPRITFFIGLFPPEYLTYDSCLTPPTSIVSLMILFLYLLVHFPPFNYELLKEKEPVLANNASWRILANVYILNRLMSLFQKMKWTFQTCWASFQTLRWILSWNDLKPS